MILILLSFLFTFISTKEIRDIHKLGIDDLTGTIKGHPIKKHSLAHQDVKLECNRPSMPDLPEESMFSWLFYPIQDDTEQWRESKSYPLCGGSDQPPCEQRLVLHNVNSSSNGLYKCSIIKSEGAGFTLTSTPVVTFHLAVRDQDPKFIEGPKHIIAYEGSGTSLECKVESEVPLTFKWFKRDNSPPPPHTTVIRYNNNTYRPVMNAEIHHEGNAYISSLIFKRVSRNDSGIYACSFLSPSGQILHQESTLEVQQSIVVLSNLVQERWEIFAALLVVIILVLVTVACMIIICLRKMWEKVDDPPLNRGRKPCTDDTDGNETSEYEHVIL